MAEVFNTLTDGPFQGWKPGFYDKNDKYYVPPKDVDVTKFKEFSLRSHKPLQEMTVYDQGALNSCVANASALAYWYELRKAKDKTLEIDGPSRFFIWWNALKGDVIDGFTRDKTLTNDGTWNRHAMKILDKIGVCPEYMQHYPPPLENTNMRLPEYKKYILKELGHEPHKDRYDQAQNNRIGAYFRLDPDREIEPDDIERSVPVMDAIGEICLDSVKRCLLDEHPVVLAFRFYWKRIPWDKSTGDIWSLPNIWEGVNGKPPLVKARHTYPDPAYDRGHAVIAIGYDDKIQRILCQNSWGDFGSKGGLFWIPYDWIRDFVATNDFWTCRLEGSDEFPSMSEKEMNHRIQNKMKDMTRKPK